MSERFAPGTLAVVTGGSRGIGRAVCGQLAEMGASILVVYLVHHDAARATVEDLRAHGAEADAISVDVADAGAVAAALDRPAAVLVNCAGVTLDRTLLKLDPEDWQSVIDVNLTGAFNCCRAVLPHMKEAGFGRIVNIASIIGQTGNVGQTNYAASKAGLIGFTKALSLETARSDITVNAICPGFIETEMLAAVPEEARATILARIPKGRFGTPQEIARAVGFLAAPAASFVTGAVLNVNGGQYL